MNASFKNYMMWYDVPKEGDVSKNFFTATRHNVSLENFMCNKSAGLVLLSSLCTFFSIKLFPPSHQGNAEAQVEHAAPSKRTRMKTQVPELSHAFLNRQPKKWSLAR